MRPPPSRDIEPKKNKTRGNWACCRVSFWFHVCCSHFGVLNRGLDKIRKYIYIYIYLQLVSRQQVAFASICVMFGSVLKGQLGLPTTLVVATRCAKGGEGGGVFLGTRGQLQRESECKYRKQLDSTTHLNRRRTSLVFRNKNKATAKNRQVNGGGCPFLFPFSPSKTNDDDETFELHD